MATPRVIRLSRLPGDDELISAVETWVADLVLGDYAAAISRTEHDAHYGWTADRLRCVIEGYGLPETHPRGPFRVTDPAHASGRKRATVDRQAVPPGAIAVVNYDLPLNGAWSDLTATFRVEPRGEAACLVSEEVHVY